VTTSGRLIAALASLSGILVVAIPVSIISTNFNSEYAKLQRQREQVKARMLLLRRHFRERKTGLDAVLDEVEDIVKRNTQEFQGELETLFEQARAELTEELQEVLRMAYERRRQLHLAALAAGRVQSSVVVPSPSSKTVRPPTLDQTVTKARRPSGARGKQGGEDEDGDADGIASSSGGAGAGLGARPGGKGGRPPLPPGAHGHIPVFGDPGAEIREAVRGLEQGGRLA
jgi:hypothetical protein